MEFLDGLVKKVRQNEDPFNNLILEIEFDAKLPVSDTMFGDAVKILVRKGADLYKVKDSEEVKFCMLFFVAMYSQKYEDVIELLNFTFINHTNLILEDAVSALYLTYKGMLLYKSIRNADKN